MLSRRANGETAMQNERSAISRGQAAREDTASRVFLFWIAAWALLTLSLFAFHGVGARTAPGDDNAGSIRLSQMIERSAERDTSVVGSLANQF
jgi:hypothetical protein